MTAEGASRSHSEGVKDRSSNNCTLSHWSAGTHRVPQQAQTHASQSASDKQNCVHSFPGTIQLHYLILASPVPCPRARHKETHPRTHTLSSERHVPPVIPLVVINVIVVIGQRRRGGTNKTAAIIVTANGTTMIINRGALRSSLSPCEQNRLLKNITP